MLVKGPLGIHLDLHPDYNSRTQLKDALRKALLQAVRDVGMEQARQKIRVIYPRLAGLGETPDQMADTLLKCLPRAHEVFHDVQVTRRTEEADRPNTLEELLTLLTSYGSR
ncbi:MAG TPA: hypothetical protein PLP29_17215 [Candidatus Ozemobacteraceae bacterium]|nr:hypothetical protein [Candidatus Ozemobacteraceae bacterium]